jgi:hypothetical protein
VHLQLVLNMWPAKNFFTSKFSYLPQGQEIGLEVQIANHLDQSLWWANQKHSSEVTSYFLDSCLLNLFWEKDGSGQEQIMKKEASITFVLPTIMTHCWFSVLLWNLSSKASPTYSSINGITKPGAAFKVYTLTTLW